MFEPGFIVTADHPYKVTVDKFFPEYQIAMARNLMLKLTDDGYDNILMTMVFE